MKRIFPLGAIVLLSPVSTALFAQSSALTDGTSNTIAVRESLIAPPVVNNQLTNRTDTAPNAGVTDLNTRGAVTGNINQIQGNTAGDQSVSVAGVEGASRANTANLNGGITADVTQSSSGSAGNQVQRVGAGSLVGSNVGTATTRGEINGPGVVQSTNSSNSRQSV